MRFQRPSSEAIAERRVALWVSAVFVAANLYYAHRYVFRHNDDGTSPTYGDTPFVWQAAKYGLVLLAAAIAWAMVVWAWRSQGSLRRPAYRVTGGLAVTLGGLLVYCAAVIGLWVTSPGVRELAVALFFLPVVLLLPTAPVSDVSLAIYRTAGLGLIGYHAVFTAVQLVAYFGFDRLPALAYAGGLVRFGGGLDDPNGFGAMVVLPILLVVSLWPDTRGPRVQASALLLILAALLFLALSFSAAAGCAVGLVALVVATRRWKLLGVGALVVLVGVPALLQSTYIREVLDAKSTSAFSRFDLDGAPSGRPGLADHLDGLTISELLFGAPAQDVASENGYVLVFARFGLIALVALLVLIVIAYRRARSTAQIARAGDELRMARVYDTLGAFVVAFSVASLGVPYFFVFPANMLFWIVAVLAALRPDPTALMSLHADRDGRGARRSATP